MGSCIICGSSVEGRICDLHQEDVVFEFRGSQPDELTDGRYYRGTVDGYAEFGVFIDIGDTVTGLLHRSELDQRLESLDWEPGDSVYVQVQNVRDNGNVDLGWSIRQSRNEFRGTLIDDPDADTEHLLEEEQTSGNEDGGSTATRTDATGDPDATDGAEAESENQAPPTATTESGNEAGSGSTGRGQTVTTQGMTAGPSGGSNSRQNAESGTAGGVTESEPVAVDAGESGSMESGPAESGPAESGSGQSGSGQSSNGSVAGETTESAEAAGSTALGTETDDGVGLEEREPSTELQLTPIDNLDDQVGEVIRIEGEITDVRQTSGPTVFEVRDETGSVDCAAFVEAGVRAFPEVDVDDVVRLEGEVERRRGELQVETEALVVLEDDERIAVTQRMEDALLKRARPDAVEPLAEDGAVEALQEEIRDAATAIRRAVLENRPVVVRHSATTDGYVAGVALERATLPLIRQEHTSGEAEYHFFDRRPLEGSVYDMEDATNDVTAMLENRQRHGEKLPLFVFAGVGGSEASLDGHQLLDVYGARRVVIDDVPADDEVAERVDVLASPSEQEHTTATAISATIAAHVNEGVREDLCHLPAVSFWEDAPEGYVDIAATAGYDEAAVREIREAIALEAFYQSYEDKRELIVDLLFGEAAETERADEPSLASHISEQFRTKLGKEIDTAEASLEEVPAGEQTLLVLDAESYTHRFEFPPVELLLEELHRAHREEAAALVGIDEDEAHLRTGVEVDVRAVAEAAAMAAPTAGIETVSPRDGTIEFLSGEREAARDAILDALGNQL